MDYSKRPPLGKEGVCSSEASEGLGTGGQHVVPHGMLFLI